MTPRKQLFLTPMGAREVAIENAKEKIEVAQNDLKSAQKELKELTG